MDGKGNSNEIKCTLIFVLDVQFACQTICSSKKKRKYNVKKQEKKGICSPLNVIDGMQYDSRIQAHANQVQRSLLLFHRDKTFYTCE